MTTEQERILRQRQTDLKTGLSQNEDRGQCQTDRQRRGAGAEAPSGAETDTVLVRASARPLTVTSSGSTLAVTGH